MTLSCIPQQLIFYGLSEGLNSNVKKIFNFWLAQKAQSQNDSQTSWNIYWFFFRKIHSFDNWRVSPVTDLFKN